MVAILVVTTIICLVLIDLIVQLIEAKNKVPVTENLGFGGIHSVPGQVPKVPIKSFKETDYRIPLGLFFHKGHTWINLLTSGHVKLGMDDFSKKSIGKIDMINL